MAYWKSNGGVTNYVTDSRDPEKSSHDPNTLRSKYLENSWICYLATTANYCCYTSDSCCLVLVVDLCFLRPTRVHMSPVWLATSGRDGHVFTITSLELLARLQSSLTGNIVSRGKFTGSGHVLKTQNAR